MCCNQESSEAENAVRAATAKVDPIMEFPSFRTYNRNGEFCNWLVYVYR